MEEAPSRKLAVILHADVVGSTGLVRLDEILAHNRIQDVFRRFSEAIATHGGIAHEVRGDAIVAEFSKASDAVVAAVDFQTANAAHNERFSDEVRPVVRVGIAMGEVVVADNTVTGEGVVLAQRLEQLAGPGGVCIQDAAYQTVPKRLPFTYESLGEREVKGFDEPVRAYAVRQALQAPAPGPEAATQPEPVTLELPEEPSIAVLPFTNMSGDPEQEFFSDGITEDIITALSRISSLLVVARNSTMVYKGKAVDVKEVGREQGVRYVLEGSVRKAGNRVRVTAQLIDAATGHHVWADRYDRELDDIFAVQDDITRNVTVEMQVQLTTGEQARLWAGGTENVEAWGYVVRGWELYERDVREDNSEARRLAETAVGIAPQYAEAWTLLGWTHWLDALWGWSESLEGALARAYESGEAALGIDPDNPHGWALLGQVQNVREQFDKAVITMEKAVALAPNHAENVTLLGDALAWVGRPDEAIKMIERGMRLSPIYPAYYVVILGNCYECKGEQELAISAYRRAIDSGPESPIGRVFLASALIEVGLVEEAETVAREVLRLDPTFYQRKKSWWLERPSEIVRKAGLLD